MDLFGRDAPWAVAAAAVTLGLVQTARLRWRAGLAARRLRAQAARAQAGEARAERLLSRAGYAVVARQAVARWRVGAEEVTVRADFLVERRARRLIAEVKTGEAAPSLSSRATRRQLLEYLCAFDADGVLLVDPGAERIEEVPFELPGRRPGVRLFPLVLALIAGVLLGALARLP